MESIPGVKQLVYLCLFAILSTDLLLVHGQVETFPRNVTAAEGQNATFLCRTGGPLTFCRIEIPGEKPLRLSDKFDKNEVFKYYGEGLEQGYCGVTVKQIKAINNGPVKCILGLEEADAEGQIDLVVALPPQRPEIKINTEPRIRGAFEIDQDFQATCISRDGRPPAQLQWFIDNEQIFEGVSPPRVVDTITGNNTTLYTVGVALNRRLQASDDRKFLICRSIHPADQAQEYRYQLQVRYRPQPLQENERRVYGLPLGQTALVNVTITANPRPRIEWSVDGIVVPQGTQNSRYESYQPVDLGNGTYNVTLAIAGLTVDDTAKTYYLKASNEYGLTDYSVLISSSPHVDATGIDIGSIIGIIVGIAILLVIIAVIVFARATGKWCFSGQSDEKPVASETSDTESHGDVNKSEGKRKYVIQSNNLLKKAFQKPEAPASNDAEEVKVSNDEEDNAAPVSESTVIMEDEPQKKDLVYAELVLKKPTDEHDAAKGPKNITEYAEIIYKPNVDKTKNEKK